ncbi:heterodimeric geranylgeranyl pyrophosphate synthase small subunit, chloroplastic-like [Olea europaea subsp. europaea]|uniref:Heterodimeric geranylgeranyl pyrophosphate synthase small subunit, chloroplastic-like n=1 Tax=Olea europaea subsp. europaea TaxID=158383 RepID=A0A8S0SPJ0_OLEEU|nr:heterodimeric geranylgeranyl pyrophosphate synthase small subunit, chloroplastic-like [Olea europaea subsp. europaea]
MATGLSQFKAKTSLFTHTRSRRTVVHCAAVVSVDQNQSFWATIEADIEAYLMKAIPIRSPVTVFEPMHYLTFAAPRTTAPALCIAACELMGNDRGHALAAASAIHLMHAAYYAHEHLPITGRPNYKREIQHEFEPSIELLTGDGMVPFGLELLSRSMDLAQNHNPDKILRVIIEITQLAGSDGMVDGLYRELELNDSNIDMGIIECVCKKKEGELHACGAACGAILGGGAEDEIEKLRKYGLYVGTIKGMQNGVGKDNKGVEEKIEKLKILALKELESLKGKKMVSISSIIEPSLVVI